MPPKDQVAGAPAPKMVRCRVVCPQYGSHYRGELVDVTEKELHRVSPETKPGVRDYRALLPLEIEERQREDAKRPTTHDPEVARQREAQAGWQKLAEQSSTIMRAQRIKQAREALDIAAGEKLGGAEK